MVGGLFDEPGAAFDRDGAGRAAARAGGAEHLHRRQLLEIRGLAGADLHARAVPGARPLLAASCSKRNACASTPKRSPRCAAISRFTSSPRKNSGSRLFARVPASFRFAFKVPEQITCKLFPRARALRPAGRQGERGVSGCGACCRKCSCVRCCRYREKTALLIFEFGAFGRRSFRRRGRISGSPGPVPGGAAAGIPLRGGDPQSRISGDGLLRLPAQPRRGARVQRVVEDAGVAASDGHSGFRDGRFPGEPRAAAPRPGV